MITYFAHFCLWVYLLDDDLCRKLGGQPKPPGPEHECGDNEQIAIGGLPLTTTVPPTRYARGSPLRTDY